ncbi:MAG: hypothetical protein LBS20_10795 [Prevotella sp.]|jgi:hypothetical protein|nr:hypothetical protein [Prevotella sp.]
MGALDDLHIQMLENRRERNRNARRRRMLSLDNLPFELSLESISESDKFTRRQDTDRLGQFNQDVRQWGIDTTKELKGSVRSMITTDRRLSDSIKPNFYYDRKYAKEINRVGFSFVREGVYVHRGAGRGQGGWKGSKWYNKKGELKETNENSLGQMGFGNRRPKEWFDPVVEGRLPQLADLVADYSATMAIDATRIFIEK